MSKLDQDGFPHKNQQRRYLRFKAVLSVGVFLPHLLCTIQNDSMAHSQWILDTPPITTKAVGIPQIIILLHVRRE